MDRSSRPFLILFGSIVALILFAGIAMAVTAHRSGMITVDIHATGPGGSEVHGLRIPGMLVNNAIGFLPDHIVKDAGKNRIASLAAERVSRVLRNAPDCSLVEVDGPDEQVRIAKRGGNLVVHVRDVEEDVHISIPLKTLEAVAKKFAVDS